jgi:hypothetical protein
MDEDIENITTGEQRLVMVYTEVRICVVCERDILDGQSSISCFTCGRIMHLKAECKYGDVQYTYADTHHCSLPCYLRRNVFEVKIVGEIITGGKTKIRKYEMLYSNGETRKLGADRIDLIAQYTKMVIEWREAHPLPIAGTTEVCVDEAEVEIISCVLPPSS